MSTAIICLTLIIICIYSIKSYTKKISHGCCGGESETIQSIKPKDKNKKNYSYCKKIGIEGMSCQNCQKRIENLFNQKDGCYLDIHLRKNIGFLYSKTILSNDDIINMIQSIGYHVTNIEDVINQ